MKRSTQLKSTAALFALLCATPTLAEDFNIPPGDLAGALDLYATSTGVQLIYADKAVRGIQTKGVKGDLAPDRALTRILYGTGFTVHRRPTGSIAIVQDQQSALEEPMVLAQAAPARAAVETVTVTSSKLGGADVQSIPISITALSQEQLTATQTAGGPDLVKQVPNMTFTKTNFSGYSIQLRGIGTQAISVTTDPAVAVAFNDTPFIRNHFFEQEFYDVAQVEVLRGPQGTLYGRNATAGVVNLTSAKPNDQFEAMASAEIGNYHQRRFEGMINLPIVDDRLDIRIAGEWTKRQGYSFNKVTNERIDGRDLWSSRVTIGLKPFSNVQAYLVWEHFSENDDRMRTAKQLCKNDPGPSEINGIGVPDSGSLNVFRLGVSYVSQGCLPASLYSPESFQVPNGFSLPYWSGPAFEGVVTGVNPFANADQSRNLRVIETGIDPVYKVKNDLLELNADWEVSPALTFTSQTGFSHDFLWSTEDYNRFDTSPGVLLPGNGSPGEPISSEGVFCDPQLGCSDRIVAEDLSMEHAWQVSQEFRLTSHFAGPFNFSVGGNYLHYETEENYYVFINSLTLFSYDESVDDVDFPLTRRPPWIPGVTDEHECISFYGGFNYRDPSKGGGHPSANACVYIDPNSIGNLNNNGHNYFLSQNPYTLNSYAAFSEAYYDVTPDVKLTAGLRFTDDRKHFSLIPSWLVSNGWGYPVAGTVNQSWDQFTGRFAANWTPKLDFTDQTLIYGSFAHGYKAGGANPPGAVLLTFGTGDNPNPIHPLTFKPEFINAFEVGTKNTLLDGALTLNASGFYYDYKDYQISEIVDRSSINLNFDARIFGGEVEASWEPTPGLRFNFAGGYEHTRLASGSRSIDLIDRTAGHSDWMVVKPFATQASNCILPKYVVAAIIDQQNQAFGGDESDTNPINSCSHAYALHLDPVTQLPYTDQLPLHHVTEGTGYVYPIPPYYTGFNPLTAPNNGEGFEKDLSGNELPNAPPLTVSAGAQYSIPLSSDWAGTLRADYYWQDYSWARVFNDNPYDRLRGYTNLNLTLILTSQNGWQVMLYDKNVFNTTAITGTFLNSDDSGLTTNVFLTDPKLIGVRVTKNW
jgi:outer membrane receptor protein involved in Fe transport